MKTAVYQNRFHYPALDGLRGLAILLVIFYHNFGFVNYFFFGWLGVDLFFVLSGFLITDILLKTKNDPGFLKKFYLRRALRIFPLYYFTLIIFFILFPVFNVRVLELKYYVENQLWFWIYLQNWLFILHPSGNNTVALSHLWSLAVEEQFYLVWPLIILLFKKVKTLVFLLIGLLVAVVALRSILWTYQIENLAYYNLYTFSRIDGICVGSLLAVLRTMNSRSINQYFTFIVLGLAIVNFAFYFFNRENQFSYPYLAIAGYTTFAVLFGLLVNEVVSKDNTIVKSIFENRVLIFFGKISFSLYVFHWPFYLMFNSKISDWTRNNIEWTQSDAVASIAATVLACLMAWLSFQFFEKRFLHLKHHFE